MLVTQFEWFLKGTNDDGQRIEMTLDNETVKRLIHIIYQQAPDDKGICETCKQFDLCIAKIHESNCTHYEESSQD